jgi:putative protease
MKEKLIGKITHYFGKISVAIVELSGVLKAGDRIHVKGGTTDFEQDISSIQIEHENVEKAKKGDAIGLKVDEKVREGDEVYLAV